MAVANGFNVRVSGLNLLEHIDKNKGFLNVMALIVAIQVLLTYVGGRILRTTPLNLHEWSVVVLFGLSIIVVDLLRKALDDPLHLFLWYLVVFQTKSDVIRHRCADELIVGILKHDSDLITMS